MYKKTYYERKSKGLCPVCGKIPEEGYVICSNCRTANTNKKNAKAELGICIHCGTKHNRKTLLCDACSEKQNEKKREKGKELKQLGLCTRCGGSTDGIHVYCDDCRQYKKELNETYIKYGLCGYCHKERIYGDEKTCPECRAKSSIKNTKYRKTHREELNIKQRERYKIVRDYRKENGLCTKCGKTKASPGKVTCARCREKNNEQKRLAYVKILVDRPNRCRYCNNDSAPGYKVCEEHRQKLALSATSKNVNEARKKTRARLKW